MKRPDPSIEHVDISSDDSSSDNDVTMSEQQKDEPAIELSSEAWLFRRAKGYQEYMKLIPIPPKRASVVPYTSWVGLGSSLKKLYNQPFHYLTNIHLKRLDQERLGSEDEDVPLDSIIHPAKAEATIWLIEEIHRSTTSPNYLAELWTADTMYHNFIDAIFPKLSS